MTTPEPAEPAELEVTPVEEWPAKKEPKIVVLPSGGIAKLQKPSMFRIARDGSMSARLRSAIAKADDADPVSALGKDADVLLDLLIAGSFVDPECLMQRSEVNRRNREIKKKGERAKFLWIGQVDEDDRLFIIERFGLGF